MKLIPLSLLLLLTTALPAQDSASLQLEKYFKAIGGKYNIDRVKNIYSLADCSGPNGLYQTEMFSALERKTIFRQMRENKPDYTGIVNGDTYWTNGPEPVIETRNTAFAWRSHELQWIAIHLTERFRDIKFGGREEFIGKQALKFSATDELGKTACLFFDPNTNLLLGFIILSPFSEKPETITLEIIEWKKTGRLLLPAKVSFSDKQGKFVLNFHTIRINRVDESVFAMPAKVIELKKLLALHDLQHKAHFDRDAPLLVSIMADDFTEIRNGKIEKPGKEALIKRFEGYFNAVTFIEWDDIKPPVIQVSDDLKTAIVHVNKRVTLKTNEGKEEQTIYAWTSTFQKINDTWQMKSITSTTGK